MSDFKFETGRYEVSQRITVYDRDEGKWQLDSISSTWGSQTTYHDISNVGVVWFNAEQGEDADGGEDADEEGPKITAIELSHNGEFVEQGTSMTLSIKADDNVDLNKDDAYAYFYAAADNIENDSIYVALLYDAAKDAFVGTFEVTEDTYPCEWTLGMIHILDRAGNFPSLADGLAESDYYVLVKNGDTFVNPDIDVTFAFDALNEAGEFVRISEVTKTVQRRTTVKEAGIELPVPATTDMGLTFKAG